MARGRKKRIFIENEEEIREVISTQYLAGAVRLIDIAKKYNISKDHANQIAQRLVARMIVENEQLRLITNI